MPCCPSASLSLHACTCALTCCPQSAGFRLPVVAAPATVTAAAAATAPVSAFNVSAAPAPPTSARVRVARLCTERRAGTGLAAIGSSSMCSSDSSSRSMSFIPESGNADGAASNHFLPSAAQYGLKLFAGGRQPRGDRLFGHTDGGRDLPVGVAVVVA